MNQSSSKKCRKTACVKKNFDTSIHYSIADILWHGYTFWKIPYHTVGTAKKRLLRIKHARSNDSPKIKVRIFSTSMPSTSMDTVANDENAAYPLSLEWIDIAGKKQHSKTMRFEDITLVQPGHQTQAFQAYMAKNGKDSVPCSSNCLSVIGLNRSIDLYVKCEIDLQKWITALKNLLCQIHSFPNNRKSTQILSLRKPSNKSYDDSISNEEALLVSATSGDVDSFLWHLKSGHSVDFMDETSGDTALIIACRLGNPEIVKIALDNGAKNDPHPTFGQTALQVAVSAGNADCVRLILETAAPSGSDAIIVNHEDSNKEAPLHVSSRCGNRDILQLLLQHGADLRLLDSQNRTCLHHACQAGHVDCLTLILESGGDNLMEERDINGFTCLHASVKANRMDCVQVLMRAGADLNTVTMEGYNVYELAQTNKLTKMQRLLKSYEIIDDESDFFPRPYDKTEGIVHLQDSKEEKKKENIFDGLEVFDLSIRKSDLTTVLPIQHASSNRKIFQSGAKNLIYKARGSIEMERIKADGTYSLACSNESSSVQTFDRYHAPTLPGSYIFKSPNTIQNLGSHHTHYAVMSGYSNCASPVQQNNPDIINSPTQWETNYSSFQQQHRISCEDEYWLVFYHLGFPYYQRESDGHTQWEDPRFYASCSRAQYNALESSEKQSTLRIPHSMKDGNETSQIHSAKYKLTQSNDEISFGEKILKETKSENYCSVDTANDDTNLSKKLKNYADVQDHKVISVAHASKEKTDIPYVQKGSKSVITMTKKCPEEKNMNNSSSDEEVSKSNQCALEKKTQDNISKSKIEAFKLTHGCEINQSHQSISKEKTRMNHHNNTKEESSCDEEINKYKKMVSVGVPIDSVVHKMIQDNISKSKIEAFTIMHDLKSKNKEKRDIPSIDSISGLPLPPAPRSSMERRTSVKMQNIHWNPVSSEKLQNSIWATDTDGFGDNNDIDEAEIEQIESLFGARSPSKKYHTSQSKSALPSTKAKQEVRLIDLKRANNIAISLAQYRAFNSYDELCRAIVIQDKARLDLEKLLNMQALLPNSSEILTMKSYKGGKDSLGRAELFFLAISKVDRFSQKLNVFVFSLQFDGRINDLRKNLATLGDGCREIVHNKGLALLLRKLLAIGNLMNEGAGKPKVAGITIDSLLKTANKKGTDGKTSLLDHVVGTILKQNDTDTILSFSENVRECSKIDIRDLRNEIRDLGRGIKNVSQAIEMEKKSLSTKISPNEDSSEFFSESEKFVESASVLFEKTEDILKETEEAYQSLRIFFAEDLASFQARTIFAILLDFSRLVTNSRESWKRNERAEKRRAKLNTPIKNSRTPTKNSSTKQNSESTTASSTSLFHAVSRRRQSVTASLSDIGKIDHQT